MRKSLATCLLLLTVALTGCGSSSNDGSFVFTGTNGGGVPDDGTFRVQFFNVDEPGATTILVQALDAAGNIVFGPVNLPFTPNFGGDLPEGAREIQVAFGDGNGTICVYQQRVLGGDIDIDNPICLEVDDFVSSIELTPETSTITVGDTEAYTLIANLVDGSEVDITHDVPLSSSNQAVATTGGLGSPDIGLATGIGPGTATISANVFFFNDSSTLTVEAVLEDSFVRIPINFEDISETGTNLPIAEAQPTQAEAPHTGDSVGGSSDDGAVFVELPFSFTLLGDTFDGVWMSTNGYLTTGTELPGFEDFEDIVTQYEPVAIPNTEPDQPHNLIGVLFTDLTLDFVQPEPPVNAQLAPDELGTLTFEVRGTAPNRRVIFQWDVRPYEIVHPPNDGPLGLFQAVEDDTAYSFQAKLFEGTNQMEFHYRDLTVDGINANDQGDGTLIGVMNEAGTDALTWMFNGEPEANQIEDGDALRYLP